MTKTELITHLDELIKQVPFKKNYGICCNKKEKGYYIYIKFNYNDIEMKYIVNSYDNIEKINIIKEKLKKLWK